MWLVVAVQRVRVDLQPSRAAGQMLRVIGILGERGGPVRDAICRCDIVVVKNARLCPLDVRANQKIRTVAVL